MTPPPRLYRLQRARATIWPLCRCPRSYHRLSLIKGFGKSLQANGGGGGQEEVVGKTPRPSLLAKMTHLLCLYLLSCSTFSLRVLIHAFFNFQHGFLWGLSHLTAIDAVERSVWCVKGPMVTCKMAPGKIWSGNVGTLGNPFKHENVFRTISF